MRLLAIRLLATAAIAGIPRSPAEGIQMVSKDERDRLIAAGQAEDAEGGDDQDDGDVELGGQSAAQLKKTAKREGAASSGTTDDLVKAITERRALFDGSGIDPAPDADLRKLAADRKVEVADDADTAAILTALKAPAAEA